MTVALMAGAQPKAIPADHLPGEYLPLLTNKKVGVVANHTATVNGVPLVDFLLKSGIEVVKVFGPEHGFQGKAGAGDQVADGFYPKTKIPLVSLYGAKKKPSQSDLEGLDLLVFDMQDVGARFFTYISTLTYVLEAAAEAKLPTIVLDRPNPHGHYVDGPVLQPGFESFVGLHPVPVIHGMTIGEYAQMVLGEGWIPNANPALLTVIRAKGYSHQMAFTIDNVPSPNLNSPEAIVLYPSLCLFEGTPVSVGRGTERPFTVAAAPWFASSYTIKPRSRAEAKNPPYVGQTVPAYNLATFGGFYLQEARQLYLFWLMEAFRTTPEPKSFFNDFFDKLAGNATLRTQIQEGATEEAIRASWKADLEAYKKIRKKYLLYTDFE
jgi:uncharacterized protein YbbC (DUF1343 family)